MFNSLNDAIKSIMQNTEGNKCELNLCINNIEVKVYDDEEDNFGAKIITIKITNGNNNIERLIAIRYRNKNCYTVIFDSKEENFERFMRSLEFNDVCLQDKAYEIEKIHESVDNQNEKFVFLRYYSIHSRKSFRIRCVIEDNVLKGVQFYPLER